MSNVFSSNRMACPDFFKVHKKRIYKSRNSNFKQLEDLADYLIQHYPQWPIVPSTIVCSNCYSRILKMSILSNNDTASENEPDELFREADDNFIPKTPERMQKFNEEINIILPGSVSPLKRKSIEPRLSLDNYIAKKKKSLVSAFSETIEVKLNNAYGIEVESAKSNENSNKSYFDEFVENFNIAFKKCSSVSEKIRLLTLLPSTLTNVKIISLFSNVTEYMIKQAKNLVKNTGVYSETDFYTGHCIDENTKNIAMEYFLNDDLHCTVQSPNKSDVMAVKINNEKTKIVKRYLSRSLKETYSQFKQDNPSLKIGRSTFYSLRPKFVLKNPLKEVCLCIYCENFKLLLISLARFRGNKSSDIDLIRSEITEAILCSEPTDSCFLLECKNCPGSEGITLDLLKLGDTNSEDEISFALWDNGNLIKQTVSISVFKEKLCSWVFKVTSHVYIKNIQREAIKKEKENCKTDLNQLIVHVDFAENWAVINNNPVQGNHWVNNQVSIFTAVCYQGETTKSFAVISDDKKHDAAHAQLALKKIISAKKNDFPINKITIISDGAASHFKNRYQLYELKNAPYDIKWLFSATGHGKGAVDGIGGLVKHYATSHNLRKSHEECIQNANDFLYKVQNYTNAIKLILLETNEIDNYRQNKKIEWIAVPQYNGIQKSHMWLKIKEAKGQVFIARSAKNTLIKIKEKKKRHKNKNVHSTSKKKLRKKNK